MKLKAQRKTRTKPLRHVFAPTWHAQLFFLSSCCLRSDWIIYFIFFFISDFILCFLFISLYYFLYYYIYFVISLLHTLMIEVFFVYSKVKAFDVDNPLLLISNVKRQKSDNLVNNICCTCVGFFS